MEVRMEELKIAICDDNQLYIETIVKYIKDYNMDYKYKLITTHEPAVLLSKLDNEKIDIAFLDIDMGDINGIDLGKEIKARYKDCIIVFVTGYKEYAFESYQIDAIKYLLKPVTEESFRSAMKEIILWYKCVSEESEQKYFTVRNKDGIYNIEHNKIYYFEKVQRNIRVHTLNKSYDFCGSLKELKEHFDCDDCFAPCCQGFIVNTNKIVEIRKDKIQIKGLNIELPVSRRYRLELKEAFEYALFRAK